MATDANTTPRCSGCGMPKVLWKGRHGRGIVTPEGVFCCKGCAEGEGCTCNVKPVPAQEAEWQEAKLAGAALLERQALIDPALTDDPMSEIDVPKEAKLQVKRLPSAKRRKGGPRRSPRRPSVRRASAGPQNTLGRRRENPL